MVIIAILSIVIIAILFPLHPPLMNLDLPSAPYGRLAITITINIIAIITINIIAIITITNNIIAIN